MMLNEDEAIHGKYCCKCNIVNYVNIFQAFAYDAADVERNGVLFSFTLFAVLLHPRSSGTVKLRSVNPFDKPVINPNIYSNLDDMKTMVEGELLAWLWSGCQSAFVQHGLESDPITACHPPLQPLNIELQPY